MESNDGIDAYRKLLEDASNELVDFQIGFVNFDLKASPEDAILAGSGTLVEIEGRHGILTADHVIENLPEKGDIGLIQPTRLSPHLHRTRLNMEFSNKIKIARGKNDFEGPDLAFLTLPQQNIGALKARKTFYNLSKRRTRILDNPPLLEEGVWLITGIAEELTTEAPPEAGYQRVKVFKGICGAGMVRKEFQREGFDYLDFEAKYSENYEGPQSYQGYSGGGLWHLIIGKKNEIYNIKEKILSGVVFYQLPIEKNIRNIRCHGRQSIYKRTIDRLSGVCS